MMAPGFFARYLLFKGCLCAAFGVFYHWSLEDPYSAVVLLSLAITYVGAAALVERSSQ